MPFLSLEFVKKMNFQRLHKSLVTIFPNQKFSFQNIVAILCVKLFIFLRPKNKKSSIGVNKLSNLTLSLEDKGEGAQKNEIEETSFMDAP